MLIRGGRFATEALVVIEFESMHALLKSMAVLRTIDRVGEADRSPLPVARQTWNKLINLRQQLLECAVVMEDELAADAQARGGTLF